MHILHISSDFSNTKVYTNLYKQLDKLGVRQTIFNPISVIKRDTIGRNEFEANCSQFVYADVIKPYHRYVYHIKRQAVFHALQKKVDLKKIDLIHAATLFTDGGQAYKIYKKYHIPYVVAVRNTDINGFLDKLPNTWLAGRKILRNAKKIFFISKALMDKFAKHMVIRPILSEISDKMMLLPNGIDDYYLDHINHKSHNGHKVLYVGDFSSNKNVMRLSKAVLDLIEEDTFQNATLTLVGGGNTTTNEVQAMIDAYPNVFHYLGPIHDKEKLCEVYNAHDVFAMPSIHETFGLVYLEALSQNLPIVYTKGQGVDGLFDETVGIGVNPMSSDEIKNAIQRILEKPDYYSNTNVNFEQFRWEKIATEYKNVYYDLISEKR